MTDDFNGYDMLDFYIGGMVRGDIKMGAKPIDFYVYSMLAFLLINGGVLITMLLLGILTKFRLGNIKRFYRISIWFVFSAFLLTGAMFWVYIDVVGIKNFKIKDFLPLGIIPFVAALGTMILGLVFSFGGRR